MMFQSTCSFIATAVATLALSTKSHAQRVLWQDHFDKPSNRPDPMYWNLETGDHGWGNGELQDYTVDSAVVSNSMLQIIAQRDGNYFSSARLNTANKVEVKYGTIEARIKVPNVEGGLWPAFWTLGASFPLVPWPFSGEIDIMEIGQGSAGSLINNRVVSAAHWAHNGVASYAEHQDFEFLLYEDYYVYTLEWTPEWMVTYINNQEIWRMDLLGCDSCDAFHEPHFLLLNMAVGGGFTSGSASSSASSLSSCGSSSSGSGCAPPTPDEISASFPAVMEVDYVLIRDNGHSEVYIATENPTSSPTDHVEEYNDPVQATAPADTASPTSAPTKWDGYEDYEDYYDANRPSSSSSKSSKGGKGSKGKSSKGYSDEEATVLCSEGSKSGKGKSGKGKSSKSKGGKSKGGKSKSSKSKSSKSKGGKGKSSKKDYVDCGSSSSLNTKTALSSGASDWSPAFWVSALLLAPAFFLA